jgi:Mrp family chromosome partitioning ATPase
MNIWEEVYSRNKEGRADTMETIDQNVTLHQQQAKWSASDSLNHQMMPNGASSFEEAYYRAAKSQPIRQNNQAPEPEPQPPKTQIKTVKSRFTPRVADRLTTSYPAVFAKMRSPLSDCWANILVETKQTIQTLLFCGAARNEGNTLISYHMAMFLSKEYRTRVLYVDTNLNHTPVSGTQNLPGLYSFVSEGKDLTSLIVQTEYPGLYLLPSGAERIGKNVSGNMLSREPIEILADFCRSNFDMTIIDGQPLATSPVMIEFARVVDMTLLVCRYGFSRYEVSKMAIDKLQKFGVSTIGAILNDRRFPIPQKLYRNMG